MRRLAVAVALAVVLGLAACAPEPATSDPTTSLSPSASESSSPSASLSPAPTSSPTASPSPSPTSDGTIALPAACESIYSAGMLSLLNAQSPPLNDPGVTLLSTQNADLLEILGSGIPTLRCSWGAPGESGLATNVSIVDAAQSAAIETALRGTGFDCGAALGGTICRIQKDVLSMDDDIVHTGETHFLRGNGWISTAWITFAPTGYTEDIAQTLWG